MRSTLSAAAAAFLLAVISSYQTATAFSLGGRGGGIARHRDTRTASPSVPRRSRTVVPSSATARLLRAARDDDDDDDDAPPENPYADPNYPDLEFVNYDDPDYTVDQGVGDDLEEAYNEDATLAEIEAMREDRRRRNDEFQFETYHAKVLRGGERSLGEWTVFQTDTFMGPDVVGGRPPEASGVPRLLKWDRTLKVVSRGSKIVTDPNAEWRVDGERIVHEERLATTDDFPTLMMEEGEELSWESEDIGHVENTFWPSEMTALDFRGPGGIMCVGKAYTICDAKPLREDSDELHEGPFSEMRTELGVQENGMRFRVKLDYALPEEDNIAYEDTSAVPPLHLRTLTVCRETLDGYWPNPSDNEKLEDDEKERKSEVRRRNQEDITAALFGPPGAPGGLYDPPPVGSEERAIENYMLLDFEGGATVLLPHRLDQHHKDQADEETFGWVTSLDWTPGSIRYQVDRKVLGGTKLKGLRTLELSEVQSDDADRYRPKDGGANMRQ
eukprot:CAMPEP_0172555242 /NCGR_PEP_ID=MMETSP1067-20121228/58315_1 /TAXON_ID=265564 ORGANISM="Thalassiosira punctigera, Strain Tpunct2005C2" /NCGR_SAMPLE_ID=MMETSP1067 /ASSEMBLY_ACC=CAM_ASM_000444 /LENGTH=499 /DNA_ID=CAMNT_0013343757 /DNA_START=10 /DNA_END=1509 /DNA_ORIENTATION=+